MTWSVRFLIFIDVAGRLGILASVVRDRLDIESLISTLSIWRPGKTHREKNQRLSLQSRFAFTPPRLVLGSQHQLPSFNLLQRLNKGGWGG